MAQRKTKNEIIAVLGYGSLGRAIALNLRDSGYNVIIGLPSNSKTRRKVKQDKLIPTTTPKAIKQAKLVCFALPDHLQGRIFEKDIQPNLQPDTTLLFLHGFSIHFGFIKPPKDIDIIMIAPHAPGISVREKYLSDRSVSAFYAVHQNSSGKADKNIVQLAKAIGIRKKKLVPTSFKDEAIGDLFGEQAVLCGGMSELILSGFQVLTKNGLPPENAYLEVAYQLDLIIKLIKDHGITGMYDRISVAARYGSVRNGKKIIDNSVKKRMEKLYKEIASGKFGKTLNSLDKDDMVALDKAVKTVSPAVFEKAAKKFSK